MSIHTIYMHANMHLYKMIVNKCLIFISIFYTLNLGKNLNKFGSTIFLFP